VYVFVQASQLGVCSTILPDEAEAHSDLVSRLAAIAVGLATDEVSVPEAGSKILMVSPPVPYSTLSGENVRKD
jgi:2-methylaconitate cis-trans-isomerase PrpF